MSEKAIDEMNKIKGELEIEFNTGSVIRANLTFYFSEPTLYIIEWKDNKCYARDILLDSAYPINNLKNIEIIHMG